MTANWSVQSDQSSASNYKTSDLQVGKATGATPTFAMAHRMGLAIITLSTALPVNKRSYINAPSSVKDENYYWDSKTKTTIYSSSTFTSNTPTPIKVSTNTCYYVTKAGIKTIFSASKSIGITGSYPTANGTDAWSMEVTIAASNYTSVNATAPTTTYLVYDPYTLTVGDVVYTDGALSHFSDPLDTNRTTSGFVGYIGRDAYTEMGLFTNNKSHALVICKQVITNCQWCTKADNDESSLTNITTLALAKSNASGYTNSLTFRNNTDYPVFYRTYHNSPTPPATSQTNWFVGSIGQWIKVFLANGVLESELRFTRDYIYTTADISSAEFDKDGTFKANILKYLYKTGDEGEGVFQTNKLKQIFTSSEIDDAKCVTIHIIPNLYMGPSDCDYDSDSKRSNRSGIPFCAI